MTGKTAEKGVGLYFKLKEAQSAFTRLNTIHQQLLGTKARDDLKKRKEGMRELADRKHKLQPKIDKHFNLAIQAQVKLRNVETKWEAFLDKLSFKEKQEFEQHIVRAIQKKSTEK